MLEYISALDCSASAPSWLGRRAGVMLCRYVLVVEDDVVAAPGYLGRLAGAIAAAEGLQVGRCRTVFQWLTTGATLVSRHRTRSEAVRNTGGSKIAAGPADTVYVVITWLSVAPQPG